MGRSDQTPPWVVSEANRCLYCADAPCSGACPAGIDVPHFVRLIRSKDIRGAKEVIREANCLGGICGYLCPTEELCEKHCVLAKVETPVRIGRLQAFACDAGTWGPEEGAEPKAKGKRVAIIGAGPAGIACAVGLRSLGYEVDLFEKERFVAGTITREIPEFKIPKNVVNREIKELGLHKHRIHLGTEVNRRYLENTLAQRYDAVFLAAGLDKAREILLKNGKLKGVHEASSFLREMKRKKSRKLKAVCVTIGGGDTALDCARTALRHGAERSVVAYRRSKEEMPASRAEFLKAVEEGIEFLWRVSPARLRGKETVQAVEFIRNELVPSGKGGRKGFKGVRGTEFIHPADTVVFALGKERDETLQFLFEEKTMRLNPKTLRLGKSKFFAGGDWVNLGKTVVQAVADGKKAAASIDTYLESVLP